MLFWLEVIWIKTEDIIRVIEAIKNSDFSEFTMENEGFRLTVSRNRVQEGPSKPVLQSEPEQEVVKGPTRDERQEDVENNRVEVTAPMVGTFYRAPSPEDEPFVRVGDRVQPEDTLCILEAMKLMNEIKSEQAGEISEIMVENGEMVEYGQPLFRIKVEQ